VEEHDVPELARSGTDTTSGLLGMAFGLVALGITVRFVRTPGLLLRGRGTRESDLRCRTRSR
jgi:hypothetical protein